MARSLNQVPLLRTVVEQYRERLTPRGQYLFWFVVTFATLGLDTRRTQVFVLFAAAAGIFLAAAFYALLPPPKLRLDCRLPERLTALVPLMVRARIEPNGRGRRDLQFSLPRPRQWGSSVRFTPATRYFDLEARAAAETQLELQIARRGRYTLRGPAVRATDPLRLAATRASALPDQVVLVYPRFYTMEDFVIPLGRRYQPGGIPLSSNNGDAIEFVGTREYREGDPVKNIHWRSWARCGEPVVKQYQEEYFCRIALILDTFSPRKSSQADEQAFEAEISVLASIADYFSRSEYIVQHPGGWPRRLRGQRRPQPGLSGEHPRRAGLSRALLRRALSQHRSTPFRQACANHLRRGGLARLGQRAPELSAPRGGIGDGSALHYCP